MIGCYSKSCKIIGVVPKNFLILPDLVSHSINTITFADGSCEVRSRSEEEAMSGHQRRRATPKIIHNPHQPEGWWRRRFLCCSSSPMHRDISSSSRPRTRRRRARHKRHRIDGTRHLVHVAHTRSTAASSTSGRTVLPWDGFLDVLQFVKEASPR